MQGYLYQASQLINQTQGHALAYLLRFRDAQSVSVRGSVLAAASEYSTIASEATSILADPWDSIIAHHLHGMSRLSRAQAVSQVSMALGSAAEHAAAAFAEAEEAAKLMYGKMEKDKKQSWWLPVIDTLCSQLRVTAYEADRLANLAAAAGDGAAGGGGAAAGGAAPGGGDKHRYSQQAIQVLQRFFQNMIVVKSDWQTSKKMGCLFVILHLFKIYFKINNLRLCSMLVRSVESPNFPPLRMFPKAQTVGYHYYLGQLNIFKEDYLAAEKSLSYAFNTCHRGYHTNKRLILQYLVPVKLLNGSVPRDRLLDKYNLPQFTGLVHAVRRGNVRAFNDALEQHQIFFTQKGIFFILEKLKKIVYRTLFKRVHRFAAASAQPKKRHMLPLEACAKALKISGVEMDMDELECIIANLIFDGYVKGYIAHSHRLVVLSKTSAFPDLATIAS